jgi:hypothetical protein
MYSHVLLWAGGIGITAIAPIHYALVRGLPIEKVRSPIFGGIYSALGKDRRSRPTTLKSLTTIWTTREMSLVSAFAPMLITSSGKRHKKNQMGDDTPVDNTGTGTKTPSAKRSGEPSPSIDLRVHLTGQSVALNRVAVASPPEASFIMETAQGMAHNPNKNEPAGLSAASEDGAAPLKFPILTGRPLVRRLFKELQVRLAAEVGHAKLASNVDRVRVCVVVCGPESMIEAVLEEAIFQNMEQSQVTFHVHKETFLL